MTVKEIRMLFLKAVQRYQYDTSLNPNRCGGVKSFCSISQLSDIRDIDESNAAKVYDDFLNGLFYSHDWYMRGASKQDLKREFPTLVFAKSATTQNNNKVCHSFEIALLEPADCKTCPASCKRPIEVVLDESERTLRGIINYLSTFEEFSVTYPNGSVKTYFDSVFYLQNQAALGKITSFSYTGRIISEFFDFQSQIVLNPFDRFTENDLRGYTVNLTFCGCESDGQTFKLDVPVPSFVGSSQCITC